MTNTFINIYTFKERSLTLATFETFVQRYEKTSPDQQKDNDKDKDKDNGNYNN